MAESPHWTQEHSNAFSSDKHCREEQNKALLYTQKHCLKRWTAEHTDINFQKSAFSTTIGKITVLKPEGGFCVMSYHKAVNAL